MNSLEVEDKGEIDNESVDLESRIINPLLECVGCQKTF